MAPEIATSKDVPSGISGAMLVSGRVKSCIISGVPNLSDLLEIRETEN